LSAVLTAEVKAYAGVIKLCALALAAGLLFFGGCHVQKQRDAGKVTLIQKQRDDAYTSLSASGDALRAANAQAATNIANAKAGEQAALQAGKAATMAEQAAKQQVDTFKARLVKAGKAPACKSILDTNVGAVCALASH
jgi:hypothetical protein